MNGVMCQATALFLEREIHIVGTANIRQGGPGYTKLESVPGAASLPPLTVGYLQDRHYQSLQRDREDSEVGTVVYGDDPEAGTVVYGDDPEVGTVVSGDDPEAGTVVYGDDPEVGTVVTGDI